MLNKIQLIGRVGADPELRFTTDGTAVAQFNLATTKSWKKNGEKQEKTTWHKIIAWRKLAEIIGQYVHKGSLIYVEGKMQSREYDGKDGTTKKVTEIVLNDMKMLGGKSEGGSSSSSSRPSSSQRSQDDDTFVPEEDDIPM